MALLTSVPGDILGLLRRGSPVWIDFWRSHCHDIDATGDPDLDGLPEDFQCRGVVTGIDDGVISAAWLSSESEDGGADDIHQDWMTLDLTDATGRAHAAWWARATVERQTDAWRNVASASEWALVQRAEVNGDMNHEQIDTLARLVLRLAGRMP